MVQHRAIMASAWGRLLLRVEPEGGVDEQNIARPSISIVNVQCDTRGTSDPSTLFLQALQPAATFDADGFHRYIQSRQAFFDEAAQVETRMGA